MKASGNLRPVALLLRCSGGFEIAVESSYADMFEAYLQRANS